MVNLIEISWAKLDEIIKLVISFFPSVLLLTRLFIKLYSLFITKINQSSSTDRGTKLNKNIACLPKLSAKIPPVSPPTIVPVTMAEPRWAKP